MLQAMIRHWKPAVFAAFATSLAWSSLALSSPAAAQQADDDFVDYTFKRGDTLLALAKSYLLNQESYRAVQQANNIRDPRRIPAGKTLRIPRTVMRSRPAKLEVVSFSGPVTLVTAAGTRQPQPGMAVPEGSELRTGTNGFISLAGDRGSLVSLPSQSHVRIVRARQYVLNDLLEIEFRMLNGRSELRPPKLRTNERYRVRTPYAVAAVRGTIFRSFVSEGDGKAGTEVVEGTVALQSGSGQSDLPEGFGQIAREAGLDPQEKMLPPPGLTDPAKIQTDEFVAFDLAPLAGAAGYRAQIARDAGFVEVVDEAVADEPIVKMGELANGTYFLRIRAIAESGIEGLAESYSFKRRRLGVAAGMEPSPLADGFKFSWLGAGEGDVLYDFKLWAEGAENAPIISELGMTDSQITLTQLDAGTYFWQVTAVQPEEGELLKVPGSPQKLIVAQ